ncbi:15213_t:CDS:2, partial [Funneliformis caledonium]
YLKAERHLTQAEEILLGSFTYTAEALKTAVDIQLVQKLQTKVISLHPETESQMQL